MAPRNSDGCSNAPDLLVLSDLRLASETPTEYPPGPCTLHDARYEGGGSELDRVWADMELYLGIIMLVEAAGATQPVMLEIWREQALAYFTAVRRFGASHWKYT